VTQFGETKVTQFFIQDGKRIESPAPTLSWPGLPASGGLSHDMCVAKANLFSERDIYSANGGWETHLAYLRRPMVLAMSILDDVRIPEVVPRGNKRFTDGCGCYRSGLTTFGWIRITRQSVRPLSQARSGETVREMRVIRTPCGQMLEGRKLDYDLNSGRYRANTWQRCDMVKSSVWSHWIYGLDLLVGRKACRHPTNGISQWVHYSNVGVSRLGLEERIPSASAEDAFLLSR